MKITEPVGLMEPMLPSEGDRELEDLAMELAIKASGLASQLAPTVRQSVGDLVRSMNCYYSNLIEGHDTHPRDIDRALTQEDYSSDPEKRALQHEAVAHIEVQRLIDYHEDLEENTTNQNYLIWLHQEFCRRMPDELLWVQNPDTSERIRVVPGKLRDGRVQVGKQIPPGAEALPLFLERFAAAYDSNRLSKVRQIIALGAAHRRLLWIHPFYDGNGRVTRLMSHASLMRCEVGSSLWSVARGLARNAHEYKTLLMATDALRRGDLDGRGTLSTQALKDFCVFFLKTCVDQVDFMASLLEPNDLLRRIRIHIEEEVDRGQLPNASFPILREALLAGEVLRGQTASLTGYGERMARNVVSDLVKKGYLKSDSTRAPLFLSFPLDAIERWFPKLYPVTKI